MAPAATPAQAAEYWTRHSVTQASTSGTCGCGLVCKVCAPPFSNTGINEWHSASWQASAGGLRRHSVTQASTSGTLPSGYTPSAVVRHSVTQASTSGTPRWQLTRRTLCFYRHSVTQASTSGTLRPSEFIQRFSPPFSNTGINEWHCSIALCFICAHSLRHSVTQASTSGTLRVANVNNMNSTRHSVTQASTSGTTRVVSRCFRRRLRHSVTQASTSGTASQQQACCSL